MLGFTIFFLRPHFTAPRGRVGHFYDSCPAESIKPSLSCRVPSQARVRNKKTPSESCNHYIHTFIYVFGILFLSFLTLTFIQGRNCWFVKKSKLRDLALRRRRFTSPHSLKLKGGKNKCFMASRH